MAPPVTSAAPVVGGRGGISSIFTGGLANITMADVKRLLGGGGGASGSGGAHHAAGAAFDRGVTTGFTGALPATAAAGGSAFAAASGGAGQAGVLLPEVVPLSMWQDAALQQFKPVIEQELGQGYTVQQLVDPPPASAGGSQIKGVVYSQSGGASGAQPTYGAALWDGTRLMDHGSKGSLEAALETATSLAAGEENMQADLSLRDILGGASLVPRAASLVCGVCGGC